MGKLRDVSKDAFEQWYQVRGWYTGPERREILRRVERHARRETHNQGGLEKEVLARKRCKYLRMVRRETQKLQQLPDPLGFLDELRQTGQPYLPIGYDKPRRKDQRLEKVLDEQIRANNRYKIDISSAHEVKWHEMLDFYPRRDCCQVLLDIVAVSTLSMLYLDQQPDPDSEIFKKLTRLWGERIIDRWYHWTMDRYAQNGFEGNFGYKAIQEDTARAWIKEEFGVESDRAD